MISLVRSRIIIAKNLIKNSKFDISGGDKLLPAFWSTGSTTEHTKPVFGQEKNGVSVSGNGNPYVFGYWKQTVELDGGSAYKLKVKFKIENIDDVNLHVLNMICWVRGEEPTWHCPHDHISYYCREGDLIVGEDTFKTPEGIKKVEIQLGMRFSKNGKISWKEVELVKTEPVKSRPVRVTVTRWRAFESGTLENNLKVMSGFFDKAGALDSDIVLLPEFSNQYNSELPIPEFAEYIDDGPTCNLIREKAREYKMNICAAILEKDGDFVFNTAVIFDRKGNYVGKYRKTHLYWPEAMFWGESPGDDFPVFELDFGKVGVVICYDSWYAETFRLLALKGAEMILFPNGGYEPLIMHARAIDNRIYVAVSSEGPPAMILDTKGKILSHSVDGMVSSVVDLSFRPSIFPDAGGTLNSTGAGRRCNRHSMSNKLYKEILQEIGTWEKRPENLYWLGSSYLVNIRKSV